MFSVSPAEIVSIALVALIVFGPKRLPDIARKAGKLASQLRATADEFKKELGGSYEETVKPFREAASELSAAGKSLKETAQGELKWVDDELRDAAQAAAGGAEASDIESDPEPGKEPTSEPGKEATPEPGKEPTSEPGKEATPEPGKEPTSEPGKEA